MQDACKAVRICFPCNFIAWPARRVNPSDALHVVTSQSKKDRNMTRTLYEHTQANIRIRMPVIIYVACDRASRQMHGDANNASSGHWRLAFACANIGKDAARSTATTPPAQLYAPARGLSRNCSDDQASDHVHRHEARRSYSSRERLRNPGRCCESCAATTTASSIRGVPTR